jgi:ABC-type glycerol-3-phosphate transport system substrate-binding protein
MPLMPFLGAALLPLAAAVAASCAASSTVTCGKNTITIYFKSTGSFVQEKVADGR